MVRKTSKAVTFIDMEIRQLTEKDTQSENQVVNIPFLKLRVMLWTITEVSSFIGTESGVISRSH